MKISISAVGDGHVVVIDVPFAGIALGVSMRDSSGRRTPVVSISYAASEDSFVRKFCKTVTAGGFEPVVHVFGEHVVILWRIIGADLVARLMRLAEMSPEMVEDLHPDRLILYTSAGFETDGRDMFLDAFKVKQMFYVRLVPAETNPLAFISPDQAVCSGTFVSREEPRLLDGW